MPTPFTVTTLFVLTVVSNAGSLAPATKAELPANVVGPIFLNKEGCLWVRGQLSNPEKYYCQSFKGETSTQWTSMPAGVTEEPEVNHTGLEPSKKALDDIQVSKPDKQSQEPVDITPPKPAPKKVAEFKRPRHDQQAMFEGNPFSGLFNW